MVFSVRQRLKINEPAIAVLIVLIVGMMIFGSFANERFATIKNVMNVIEQAAPLAFVAIGQMLVVIAGGIDLSIGAIVAVSSVLLAGTVNGSDTMMVPILLAVLLLGAFIGAMNGLVALTTGVHPLIVTLGMSSILNGLVLLYTLQPLGKVPVWYEEFAYGRILGFPTAGLVMFAVFAVVAYILRYRRIGRSLFATGGNREAARLTGIRTNRATIIAYAASGFFAAIAGAYFVSRTGVGDPRVGDPMTLASITPVVIGGTILGGGRGRVLGTLLGVIMVSLLNNLLNYMSISTFYQWVIQGLVIIAAVAVFVDRSKRL
jgi:ribose transport system permease protein